MTKKKYDLHLKGYVGGYRFDSDEVDRVLDAKADEVNVLINSLGGSLATGLVIASAFNRHGNVNVHFAGMNASAATVASLGAKHITMDKSAMYLVHKVSTTLFAWDSFNADKLDEFIKQLKDTKEDLAKMDINIASMYAERCKCDKEKLLELMKKGGWLTAEEAKEWGFVDELTEFSEDKAPAMTNAMVADFENNGIPVPNVPMAEDGAVTKLINALTSFFTRKADKEENKEDTPSTLTNMIKKNFKNICSLLGVEDLTAENETFALTNEQLDSIENALAEKDARIAQLSAEPAEESNSVVDDGADKSVVTDDFSAYVANFNSAKDLYNKI